MGPVEVMLRWTISLQINFLLSNAYMKCWLNFTRTFPRNTHVLAALAILLTGLSSMEPGAKKKGGGPTGTFRHCCLWPHAGSQRQTNSKFSWGHPVLTGYPSL